MNEPTNTLAEWQSFKVVRAGEITETVTHGCFVKNEDGTAALREFLPKMTSRYEPGVGDFWVVYEDGYQSISPRRAFLEGYMPASAFPKEPVSLEAAITREVNKWSAENGSNTPDFILAEYLMDCLKAWNKGVTRRESWYGREPGGLPVELSPSLPA